MAESRHLVSLKNMALIQFKRVLNFTGDFDTAVDNIINKLDPKLQDGEPLLCSYMYNGSLKYLLAIGVQGNVRVFPMFSSMEDIENFIRTNSVGINLIDNISTKSDFEVSQDSDGKLVFEIKDNLKNNWIYLNE